jgi:integration host factor subunit alpha
MSSVETLTRAAIADAMHHKLGLSRAESLEMVESILSLMCKALGDGENVKISGFGTFLLRDKGERVGRNPKTGIEVPITPRRVLTFRSSQILKQRVTGS